MLYNGINHTIGKGDMDMIIKKRLWFYIIPALVVLAVLFALYVTHYDKYSRIESINLDSENINGISLMSKYDEAAVEKILGKVYTQYEKEDYHMYLYDTTQFSVAVKADEQNDITGIYCSNIDDSLKTSRDIAKGSTFFDIRKAYGDSFIKKSYSDFMGSGDGYFITYADKSRRSQLQFEFNNLSGETVLTGISLSKY